MLTPEEHHSGSGWPKWAVIIGLAALFSSGVVIALDGVVDRAGPVVLVALLVALAAALTVVGGVWAESRRSGLGLIRSLGRSLRALGRFVVDFF